MKADKYVLAAIFLIASVFFLYFLNFFIVLGYGISDDSEAWSHFGGYVGGVLGPSLSFLSIVLLIKSLNLQSEANKTLISELNNSEKTEKLRSFEALFFSMLESQRNIFESFRVELDVEGEKVEFQGVESVLAVESVVEHVIGSGGGAQNISDFLDSLDSNDQVFGLIRSFYVIVMMIDERLSDDEGFSVDDRRSHFKTLINFTSFPHLRFIMMCVQFMDFESARYLRSSIEFREVVTELGMSFELY